MARRSRPTRSCGLACGSDPPPAYPARLRPPDLSGPAAPDWDAAAAGTQLHSAWAPVWEAALGRDDLDAAWGGLAAGAAEFLAARAGDPGRAAGRAVGARPQRRRAFAGVASRDGDAICARLAVVTLRARRMAALVQAWPDGLGCLPQRAAEILAAARHSSIVEFFQV